MHLPAGTYDSSNGRRSFVCQPFRDITRSTPTFASFSPRRKAYFLSIEFRKGNSGTILIRLLLADLQLKRIWEPDLVRVSVIHGLGKASRKYLLLNSIDNLICSSICFAFLMHYLPVSTLVECFPNGEREPSRLPQEYTCGRAKNAVPRGTKLNFEVDHEHGD